MKITFEIARKVVCKRNEKGIENPYMLYNLFWPEIYNDAVENFFCRSHSDGEHNSKRHIRSKIKIVTCDNREEIDAYIGYQRQKRERGSEKFYAKKVRMCTSTLMKAKKCKGG